MKDIIFEQKVKAWSEANLPARYLNANIKLLEEFYARKNIAKTIGESIEDQQAILDLLVTKKLWERPVCAACSCKNCKCGKQDYSSYSKGFAGYDKEGHSIIINISGFYKGCADLQIEHFYKITGEIEYYNNKKTIKVKEIDEHAPSTFDYKIIGSELVTVNHDEKLIRFKLRKGWYHYKNKKNPVIGLSKDIGRFISEITYPIEVESPNANEDIRYVLPEAIRDILENGPYLQQKKRSSKKNLAIPVEKTLEHLTHRERLMTDYVN